MNALKHYNSIIDKWIELKEISKNFGMDKSPFETMKYVDSENQTVRDIIQIMKVFVRFNKP